MNRIFGTLVLIVSFVASFGSVASAQYVSGYGFIPGTHGEVRYEFSGYNGVTFSPDHVGMALAASIESPYKIKYVYNTFLIDPANYTQGTAFINIGVDLDDPALSAPYNQSVLFDTDDYFFNQAEGISSYSVNYAYAYLAIAPGSIQNGYFSYGFTGHRQLWANFQFNFTVPEFIGQELSVPEPGTAMLGLSGIGFVLRRRPALRASR